MTKGEDFCRFERSVRAGFDQLSVPALGVTPEWLRSVQALRFIVADGISKFGAPAQKLVCEVTNSLEGSAKAAWGIAAELAELAITIDMIESKLLRYDGRHIPHPVPAEGVTAYVH